MLPRFFKMQVGKDYKVISLQGEPERIAALLNKDIDAAMVSAAQGMRAVQAGMKIVLRTGDHMPRVGGCFWVTEEYFEKNQDTVKKFIRAIAKGVMYFRDNKAGSLATLKEHLGIENDEQAGLIWDELHNTFARGNADGPVSRDLRVAPARPDRRQAMAGGQAAARSGAVPAARAARIDAEGDELRADQASRRRRTERRVLGSYSPRRAAAASG